MAGSMLQICFFLIANALAVFHFAQTGNRSLLAFFVIAIAILVFFSALIARLEKKGHLNAHELMARTMTFWWMLSLFALALISHPMVICLLLYLGSFLSLAEYHSLIFPEEKSLKKIMMDPSFCLISFACLVNYALLYFVGDGVVLYFGFSLIFMGIGLPIFYVIKNRGDESARSLLPLISGFLFFAVLLTLAYPLYAMNVNAFLVVIFLTEIRDLISYWLGKGLAKTTWQSSKRQQWVHQKIAPAISPNKTWSVGILSTVIIYAIGLWFSLSIFDLGYFGLLKLSLVLFSIGIFGLFGDLAFSLVKRIYGQKDSGSWLPGGSGMIDRIDALVFTIPVAYFILQFL